MPANYSDLVGYADELAASYKNERGMKAALVGAPLSYSGEFFKTVLSNVVGFQWFIPWSCSFDLPSFNISLPTPMYLLGRASELSGVSSYMRSLAITLGAENPLISQFAMGSNSYKVNPINFWAIPFNYLARNLGKGIGWVLVSPFTIPANLITKAYYGIKRSILNIRINRGLKTLKPEDVAETWLERSSYSQSIPMDKIAQYVDTNSFFTGLLTYHNNKLSSAIQYGYSEISIPNEHYTKYCEARNKVLVSEQRWALAGTILSGVLLLPLLFTIPAYKKLTVRQNAERNLQSVGLNVLDKFRSINEKRDSENQEHTSGTYSGYGYSQRYTSTKKYSQADYSDLYFIYGKELLEAGRPDLAFNYFSKVPENSQYYKESMNECGSLLLAGDNSTLANEYFQKAGEERFTNITKLLASNPDATMADVKAVESDKKTAASAAAQAPFSPARAMGALGVLANQGQSSANNSSEEKNSHVRGLDEDEEVPSPRNSSGTRLGGNQSNGE